MGTPFAPKTLFFTMKKQDFEVHFGPQNGVLRRPFFSSFFVFFIFFGFIFRTLFGARFRGFWSPKRSPKLVENRSQNQFFFWSALGAPFLGFRAPSGRSFAAFWASWGHLGGSQERKNADSPMRKPLFGKSSFWLLGALFASLRLL